MTQSIDIKGMTSGMKRFISIECISKVEINCELIDGNNRIDWNGFSNEDCLVSQSSAADLDV